ncbi:MAG: hypothetical protein ABJN26_12685 [Stappiaceae bacterium]
MNTQSNASLAPHPARTHLKVNSINWWIWVLLSLLMALSLAGYEMCQTFALSGALMHAAVSLARHRYLAHFPTQVRITFVFWLALSFIPALSPLLWSLTVGTLIFVLFGYCPIARMLLFLPFNRDDRLTLRKVREILLHPPVYGSIRHTVTL